LLSFIAFCLVVFILSLSLCLCIIPR
jgi:hypothetical protein